MPFVIMVYMKQLNDKNWLIEKYFDQGFSTSEIAVMLGVKSPNSVRQALLKFGLEVRDRRQAQVNKRVSTFVEDVELLEGTLLGDAGLQKFNKFSDLSAPYYNKKSKHLDYTIHVASLLTKSSEPKITPYVQTITAKDKTRTYQSWVFRTQSDDSLLNYYQRWYPKDKGFVKTVPTDLVLTPRVVLYWFMDDGSTTFRNRNKEYKNTKWSQKMQQVILTLCSESFTHDENEFLACQLRALGLNAVVRGCNSGSGYRVHINQSTVKDFFDLIGECPVESMKYKWKLDNSEK
jgi:hypothetical protein